MLPLARDRSRRHPTLGVVVAGNQSPAKAHLTCFGPSRFRLSASPLPATDNRAADDGQGAPRVTSTRQGHHLKLRPAFTGALPGHVCRLHRNTTIAYASFPFGIASPNHRRIKPTGAHAMNGHFAAVGDGPASKKYEHGIQIIDEDKAFTLVFNPDCVFQTAFRHFSGARSANTLPPMPPERISMTISPKATLPKPASTTT